MSILEIDGLTKYYNKNKILDDINLSIGKGDVISIIGPSGAGKSTLLRCIIGLESIEKGKIKESEKINKGMVFQNFNLFPHKTVLENIVLAPSLLKIINKNDLKKIGIEFLKKVGLEDKKDDYPGNLSGGQKQRVAIARTLIMNPDIILFDEPTSALDPELVLEVLNVIKELKKENITMIIVTHEINFARDVSSKIIFMEKGKVLEYGDTNKIFYESKNKRIKDFLNKIG